MEKTIPQKPTHRKRSPFYWWRRFPTHKPLHPYVPLLDRIKNGDFDYPEFFEQAKWEDYWCEEEIQSIRHLFQDYNSFNREAADIRKKYAKRRNLLIQDGFDAEKKRLNTIVNDFRKTFGGSSQDVYDFMETFDGTVEEMFWAYAKHTGIRVPDHAGEKKIIEKMLGEQAKKRGRGRPRKNPLVQ